MGKGGNNLLNPSKEIKDLDEWNNELKNKIKVFEWKLQQNQTIMDKMIDTLEYVKDL